MVCVQLLMKSIFLFTSSWTLNRTTYHMLTCVSKIDEINIGWHVYTKKKGKWNSCSFSFPSETRTQHSYANIDGQNNSNM